MVRPGGSLVKKGSLAFRRRVADFCAQVGKCQYVKLVAALGIEQIVQQLYVFQAAFYLYAFILQFSYLLLEGYACLGH